MCYNVVVIINDENYESVCEEKKFKSDTGGGRVNVSRIA